MLEDIGKMYDAWTGQMLVDSKMQKERSLDFACEPYFYLIGNKAYTTEIQGLEPNNFKASVVSEYYTDGKELFVLCELDGKMYRIERKNEPYTLSLPIGDIVYEYRFDFFPIGERVSIRRNIREGDMLSRESFSGFFLCNREQNYM